jgi:hypothetical protein
VCPEDKGKMFNVSLICAHVPTEEAEEEIKDKFYELENIYDNLPKYDVKILLGDMNAKIGREGALTPTIGLYSLHELTNDNGIRLVDFAMSKGMTISSTYFEHKDIHKATWVFPDGNTFNQIDYCLIDRRHGIDIMDVRSMHGADCEPDHFMILIKYRQRIAKVKNGKSVKERKFDVGKLHRDEMTVQRYMEEIDQNAEREEEKRKEGIEERWLSLKCIVTILAETVLGYESKGKENDWFDDECKKAVEERNRARLKKLERITRASVKEYSEKRKMAKRICRKKKEKKNGIGS